MEEERLSTCGMSLIGTEEAETDIAIASSSGMLHTVTIQQGHEFLGDW